MKPFRRFFTRVRNTITGRGYERRLKEELDGHLAWQTEENLRAGLPPEEARRQAVLKFGSVEAVKEDLRTEHAMLFVQTFFRDLRYALRGMRRSPGFTAVGLITLALAIGANTTLFSAINGILIEHLPYAHASRLLVIQREQVAWGITPNEIRTLQQQYPAFERLSAVSVEYLPLTIGDAGPISRWSGRVAGDFFPMFEVTPLLGRYIFPSDAQPESPPVAVLSYHLWKDAFGGDPLVLGREIVVDKKLYSIVGVMPREFEFAINSWSDQDEGLWVPLANPPSNMRLSKVIGRVKEGTALSVAQAQVQAISPMLAERFPKNAEHTALTSETPQRHIDPDVRRALLILQGAVALVLLVACVNIGALLVSRAWSRQKDLAIRKALGASRFRIVRQLLSESLLLALMGGSLGLLLSAVGIRLVRAIAPPGTPRLDRMELDGSVFLFTFAISVLSAVLFGLLPALQLSKFPMAHASGDPLGGLLPNPAGRRRHFLRSTLLVAEVGLALIVLVGATLVVRSFDKLMRVDIGLRADHVLTMDVELSPTVCKPNCKLTTQSLLDQIESLPGIERAGLAYYGPFGGMNWLSGILFEGAENEQSFDGVEKSAAPGFFQAAGMRILQGRDFVPGDGKDVAIVTEEFARKYFQEDPLGKRFSPHKDANGGRVWLQIVGVVNGTRNRAIRQFHSGASYYTPVSLDFGSWQLLVRTSGDPMPMAAPIQRIVRAVDKAASVTKVATLEQTLYESAALPRFQTTLFGLFGVLALLLAVVGIYGVTSYSVVQRTHEIGIRMALGARAEDVVRSIVAQGGYLALGGIAIGLAGAAALARFLETMLFELQPVDYPTFVSVAAMLFAAALAACYFPARVATRLNPVTALRHE